MREHVKTARTLGINADVPLAPLTSTFRPMLFTFPFSFAQELDASGVEQQIQVRFERRLVGDLIFYSDFRFWSFPDGRQNKQVGHRVS